MLSRFKSWCRDQAGNTALITALAAVPLVGSAGVAVDMIRAHNAQINLQAATDAAALAAGSDPMASDVMINKVMADYLAANGLQHAVDRITKVDFNRDPKSTRMTLKVTGELDTTLAHVLGIDKLDLEAYSEVESGTNSIEVVLVLDNTYSMSAEKRIDTLKKASKKLVQRLMKSKSGATTMKIGIVPFSRYVNVGMASKGSSWLNVPADVPAVWYENQKCEYRKATGTWDGVPSEYDEAYNCVPVTPPIAHPYTKTWHGCVGSRSDLLDTRIDTLSDRYPGILDASCASELTPLTANLKLLEDQLDKMVTIDETYIAPGVLWGWNVLAAGEPFTGAMTKDELKAANGHKIMVLMTDGDNTLSASYPEHGGNDNLKADIKTATLCDNVKKDGIRMYTVAFKVDKKSSLDLLQNCATDSTMAFDADNDDALIASFDEIAASLASLRLAK
jgi:Flp pilus assembly protein TadG